MQIYNPVLEFDLVHTSILACNTGVQTIKRSNCSNVMFDFIAYNCIYERLLLLLLLLLLAYQCDLSNNFRRSWWLPVSNVS
jgi:hypothetical protein